MTQPWYQGRWHRVRKAILERDGHICQIRGPKCRGIATCVDHVIPPPQGDWWNPDNLRASCLPCNGARVDHTAVSRWMKSSTIIVLVIGPPFADLYDYCLAHRSEDDRIIDFGTIAKALGYDPDHLNESSLRQVQDQRNAMLNSVRRGESTSTRVWITSSNPNAERLFPHHTIVVVGNNNIQPNNIGQGNDHRQTLIDEWYMARQGRSTGTDQPSRDW